MPRDGVELDKLILAMGEDELTQPLVCNASRLTESIEAMLSFHA